METITLGNHKGIPVVPQKHARLRNRLSAQDFRAVMTGNYAAESYRLLCILIPPVAAIPLWEYEGYGSQEHMDRGEYVDELDNGPDTAQIVNAFEVALKVSGAGRVGKILDLIGSVGKLTQIQTAQPPASPGPTGE